ncbi:MAG TPA: acetolactate decarboxylase [Bacteroidia bacterium]|nr:acetolactate decarboxylase [Bacteroidia bacterium]
MKLTKVLFGMTFLVIQSATGFAQRNYPDVAIVGAMKNVMWKGQLYGTINIDTISNKTHLYGIGPLEYLKGELMILDGRSFKSTVVNDSTMKVEETYNSRAPFFGYTHISKWEEQLLPDSIITIEHLQNYLNKITNTYKRPFMFKMSGPVDEAIIHVVNLPEGSKVSSPNDAHAGQKNFKITKQDADILGFFSTEHQTIFTHHDTFLHLHLLTKNHKQMGHVDEMSIQKGKMKLYLPIE